MGLKFMKLEVSQNYKSRRNKICRYRKFIEVFLNLLQQYNEIEMPFS